MKKRITQADFQYLVLDIGNTMLKAIFVDTQEKRPNLIVRANLTNTFSAKDKDQLWEEFLLKIESVMKETTTVKELILVSVNPYLPHESISEKLRKLFPKIPLTILSHQNLFPFQSNVTSLEEVGLDLLCDVAAVVAANPAGPAIIIDSGTVTKLIFITLENGQYVLQGVNLLPSLDSYVYIVQAAIPHLVPDQKVLLVPTKKCIGQNTVESLQIGGAQGFIIMLQGLIENIKNHFRINRLAIYFTGGQAETLYNLYQFNYPELNSLILDDVLVAKGAASLYEINSAPPEKRKGKK